MKKLVLIFIILFSYLPLVHSQDFMFYQTLDTQDGLSNSNVKAVVLDKKGNLWIGTANGLNKYSAGRIIQYFHSEEDENSLQSNEILQILEDDNGRIWVICNGGLSLYDPNHDRFTRQKIGRSDLHKISCICMIDNQLYISGIDNQYNIYRYDYNKSVWEHFYNNIQIPAYSLFMRPLGEHKVLLHSSTDTQLQIMDMDTKKLTPLDYLPKKKYDLVYPASDGTILVANFADGFYIYRQEKLVGHYTTENSRLSNNIILDCRQVGRFIWLATDGGGLCTYNMDTAEIIPHAYDIANRNSCPANSVQHLYIQKNGNILAGTVRDGLISIKNVYAQSYSEVYYGTRYGLSNKNVICCIQDRNGMVWIGTELGGINQFNPKDQTFKHFESTKNQSVTTIYDYSDSEIMYFSYDKGLKLMNKITGAIHPLPKEMENLKEIVSPSGVTIGITRYSPDEIIINSRNIYLYNLRTHQTREIMQNKYKTALPITFDDKKQIYAINDRNVVSRYNPADHKTLEIARIDGINDILYDKQTLWLATDQGLKYLKDGQKEVQSVQTPLFSKAKSIIMDNRHRLWTSTENGLFVYSFNNVFYNISTTEGISQNDYLPNVQCLLSNGYLISGGNNGLSYINCDIEFQEEQDYSIQKQSIALNDQWLHGQSPHIQGNKITIPWNFLKLQIAVSLNNGQPLSENVFRFQIIDQNSNVQFEVLDESMLTLNNFSSGSYIIKCSYYRRNGEWSTPQILYRLEIYPPWWKSTWFITLLILLIGTAGIIIQNNLLRKKRIRNEMAIAELKNKHNEDTVNLMTNISHELRTPLTLICSPLKRIINGDTPQDKIMPTLNAIYSHANHMKSIINMILDVRKFDEGKTHLQIENNQVNEWIKEVTRKFKAEFENKDITLDWQLDPDLPLIAFDRNKCEFVLSNFLMNAFKFSEPGSHTLVRSRIIDSKYVRISVSDEGMGLKMIDLDSLFDNFYQGAHDKGGSGIGLAYAKSLITYHHGRIGAENNPRGGATFYFDLPIVSITQEAIDIHATSFNQPISTENLPILKEYTILIVEDNDELRNYLKDTLGSYYKKVLVASDGKEGFEIIRSRVPDIIVSDLMMPFMNGFELCRKVKTDLLVSHIPFILLTAYNNEESQNMGYKTGADVFLGKPFEIDSLVSVTYNLLQLRNNIKTRIKNNSHLEIEPMTAENICFSNADEEFMNQLNKIILESLGDPDLNIDRIADALCMSRSLLFSKMKAITGMTMIDYISNIKIEKANRQLAETDRPIAEIALELGFKTPAYFARVYKKLTGISPSEFRKNLKENQVR